MGWGLEVRAAADRQRYYRVPLTPPHTPASVFVTGSCVGPFWGGPAAVLPGALEGALGAQ